MSLTWKKEPKIASLNQNNSTSGVTVLQKSYQRLDWEITTWNKINLIDTHLPVNIIHQTKKTLCSTATPLEELFRLSKFKRSGLKYIEMRWIFEINREGTKVYVNLEVKKKKTIFSVHFGRPQLGIPSLKRGIFYSVCLFVCLFVPL